MKKFQQNYPNIIFLDSNWEQNLGLVSKNF